MYCFLFKFSYKHIHSTHIKTQPAKGVFKCHIYKPHDKTFVLVCREWYISDQMVWLPNCDKWWRVSEYKDLDLSHFLNFCLMQSYFPCFWLTVCLCVYVHLCYCRGPSGWQEANLPHPIWPLKLQDGAEGARTGDGVHCRRTVSQRICQYWMSQCLECPPTQSQLLNPGPPLRYPGQKWVETSPVDACPSFTSTRPCRLWTCLNRMREITVAQPGTSSALRITQSASWSMVRLHHLCFSLPHLSPSSSFGS